MTIITVKLLKSLLLPPGILILGLTAGLVLRRLLPRTAMFLSWGSLILLYLLCTPWLGLKLAQAVDYRPALSAPPISLPQKAAAIVVLGAGRRSNAPEFGGRDALSASGLARLHYAARLHRQTGYPILVTGGTPLGEARSEASLMQESLRESFGISSVWLEERSRNTFDHGRLVPPMLREKGISSIILVTDAAHMARALGAFATSGLTVLPAPSGIHTPGKLDSGWMAWRPSATALFRSAESLQELAGRWWYRWRYGDRFDSMRTRLLLPAAR